MKCDIFERMKSEVILELLGWGVENADRGERLVKWVIEWNSEKWVIGWNSEKWMKIACFGNCTFSLSHEYIA
jgi:hypothetical protein